MKAKIDELDHSLEAPSSHSKKVPGFSVWTCPCGCSSGPPASSQSPQACFWLTSNSKLTLNVYEHVDGCVSLYVGPVMSWRHVQGNSVPFPEAPGTGSGPPGAHNREKSIRRWMDGWTCSANISINTEYHSCLTDGGYKFFWLTCLITSFSAGASLQRTIHVTFANF